MQFSRKTLTLAFLAIVAVMAVAALLGHPVVPPEALAGLGMLPMAMSGEIDAKEIKDALDKQAEVWGEFTRKNNELLAAKAEGKAVADLQATVEKLNGELTKLGTDLVDIAKKSNRPAIKDAKGNDLTEEQIAYKQAFGNFIRKGGSESDLASLARKAYNSGSIPDGAVLVLPEMDSEIIRVVGVVSAIGRLATVKTIGSDTYKKSAKKSGMTARRVGPGATGGETSTPQFAELEFTAHTAEAEPWVFNETLEDAIIDVEMDLADEAAIAFSELAGVEFARGTGVGEARGITAYDTVANSSYSWGKIGFIKSGASADFAATNPGDAIIDLQHSLKSQYRPGAAFVMGDATLSKVRQMKDGSGNFYLWQPDPLTGFGGRLLGSPVEIDDNMPTMAANSFSIAYGDFKQGYVVVNRSGTVLIRDNLTAKGKTKFNFRRRFGGGVQNFEAIKLMKFIN
ncbi:MAG: phage major capsid protein [Curvibacter sp. PD_MW3]|nr:MAG: phage major capsid protein [Curvibacter sp. PD_MW3]